MKLRLLPYKVVSENDDFFVILDVNCFTPRLCASAHFDLDTYFEWLLWEVKNGKI